MFITSLISLLSSSRLRDIVLLSRETIRARDTRKDKNTDKHKEVKKGKDGINIEQTYLHVHYVVALTAIVVQVERDRLVVPETGAQVGRRGVTHLKHFNS